MRHSSVRLAAPALTAALVLAGCTVSGGGAIVPVGTAPFNPRPTQPYECSSMTAAPRVWVGYFSGQKEVDRGFFERQTTRQRACFVSQRECENWLYNMQSEYTWMVWRAECRPGLA